MPTKQNGSRIVAVVLATGMLAVIVVSGIAVNAGVGQGTSSCTYGSCPAAASFPPWAIGTSVLIVIIALIAGLLLLRRRRKQPPAATEAAPAAAGTGGWTESDVPEGEPAPVEEALPES
jgi:predicted ABC-type sugar transport system permease subunit